MKALSALFEVKRCPINLKIDSGFNSDVVNQKARPHSVDLIPEDSRILGGGQADKQHLLGEQIHR
jgi:hypothetical protein